MALEFKTVTFRLDQSSRSALPELGGVLHLGDSLKLVFTGAHGVDAASCFCGIYQPAASAAPAALASSAVFAYVPGRKDAVYCSLDLDGDALRTLLAAVVPGKPLALRVYLSDVSKTWLDEELEVYPCPTVTGSPADPADRFVAVSDIVAAVTPVQAMPVLTAAQLEAKVEALIAALLAL